MSCLSRTLVSEKSIRYLLDTVHDLIVKLTNSEWAQIVGTYPTLFKEYASIEKPASVSMFVIEYIASIPVNRYPELVRLLTDHGLSDRVIAAEQYVTTADEPRGNYPNSLHQFVQHEFEWNSLQRVLAGRTLVLAYKYGMFIGYAPFLKLARERQFREYIEQTVTERRFLYIICRIAIDTKNDKLRDDIMKYPDIKSIIPPYYYDQLTCHD